MLTNVHCITEHNNHGSFAQYVLDCSTVGTGTVYTVQLILVLTSKPRSKYVLDCSTVGTCTLYTVQFVLLSPKLNTGYR